MTLAIGAATTPQTSALPSETTDARRSTEPRIALAMDLGWRLAELYALNVEYEPAQRTCDLLPVRRSLSRRDRLELELLAAVGTAKRLDVDLCQDRVGKLRELAGSAAEGNGGETKFREELERCHVALDKQLWTHSEAEGRSYELGIMLSDTYNRICRVYHERPQEAREEWAAVFTEARASELQTLLDDLQSRLDPGAVTVVRDHLEAWRKRVRQMLNDGEEPPPPRAAGHVRDQTLVWRQLLTGDKEPEAFLDPRARARVRGELVHLMWRRYWSWIMGLFAALMTASAGLLLFHADIGAWYSEHTREAAIVTSVIVSLAGALGISKGSINRAVSQDLRKWSALLWNRALARVVCMETLRIDHVFPERHSRPRRALETLTRHDAPPIGGLRRGVALPRP